MFEVIGSQDPTESSPQQHRLPSPDFTRSAAWAYFSRTTSLRSGGLIEKFLCFLRPDMNFRGTIALLRVQHSAYRKPSNSSNASVLAAYQCKEKRDRSK